MDNGINERQNEEKSIRYLAAQRQLYSEAKWLNNILIIISVFFPFVLSIVETFFKQSSINDFVSFIIVIIFCISICLTSYISSKKDEAAEIQQYFDIYVFQMSWNNKLFGKRHDLNLLITKKAGLLFSKKGEREKLLEWYPAKLSNRSLFEGIYSCQKTNIYWDVSLKDRFKSFSIIVIVILIILIFIIDIIHNALIIDYMAKVVFLLPILKWLFFDVIKPIRKDIKTLKEIVEIFDSNELNKIEDLQIIQSKIYNHRKSGFIIPDIFYNYFKNTDKNIVETTIINDKK